jgi:hypothetical protein
MDPLQPAPPPSPRPAEDFSDAVVDLIRKSVVVLRSNPTEYIPQAPLVRLVSTMTAIINSGAAEQQQPDEPAQAWAADCDLALWRALALSSTEDIAYRFRSSGLTGDEDLCIGELVSMAAFRLSTRSEDARRLAAHTATQLWKPAVDVAPDVAVGCYTASEMSGALLLLRKAVCACAYSDHINHYIGALTRRAAELVLLRWPAQVHDAPLLRKAVPGQPQAFECAQEFVVDLWTTLSAVYRRVLFAVSIGLRRQEMPPPDAAEARKLEALKAFLLQRVETLKLHQPAAIMKNVYPETQLRPGDTERVRASTQEIMPRPLGIINATSEPARMQRIASAAERALGATILEELRPFAAGQTEPPVLGLCLCELVEILSNGCGQSSFARAFSVTEPEMFHNGDSIAATLAAVRDRPIVVQVFNHWQVAYLSTLYVYNSFLRALLDWLGRARAEYVSGKPERLQDHIGLAFLSKGSVYCEMFSLVTAAAAAAANE